MLPAMPMVYAEPIPVIAKNKNMVLLVFPSSKANTILVWEDLYYMRLNEHNYNISFYYPFWLWYDIPTLYSNYMRFLIIIFLAILARTSEKSKQYDNNKWQGG